VTDCVDMVRSWAMKAVRVSEKLEIIIYVEKEF